MARKKKKKEERTDSSTALFLSLMIILLAFFIMLNSIATLESERIERALRSIQASHSGLGIFGQGVGLKKESDSPGGADPTVIVMDRVHEIIQQSLVKWGDNKMWTESYEDERRMIISIKDAAIFASGSESLHPRIFPMLNGLGELVKTIGIPLTVQGHSDPSGSDRLNWVVSARRAIEVARYFTEGVQVPEQLIEAEAFADTRPLESNATQKGRDRNRRVDLVFYKRDLARLEVR